jgi:hypothetical protein
LLIVSALIVYVVVMMGVDITFAAFGIDVTEGPSQETRLYDVFYPLCSTLLSGFILSAALFELGDRPWRASLLAALQIFLLNIKLSVSVVVPLILVGILAAAIIRGVAPESLWLPLIAPVAVLLICVLAYLMVRLSFAGPRAVATGRSELWPTWPTTRGKFWPLVGAYLAIAVAGIASMLVVFLGGWFAAGVLSYAPLRSLDAALMPGGLILLISNEFGLFLLMGYWTAAHAHLFHVMGQGNHSAGS